MQAELDRLQRFTLPAGMTLLPSGNIKVAVQVYSTWLNFTVSDEEEAQEMVAAIRRNPAEAKVCASCRLLKLALQSCLVGQSVAWLHLGSHDEAVVLASIC